MVPAVDRETLSKLLLSTFIVKQMMAAFEITVITASKVKITCFHYNCEFFILSAKFAKLSTI